jgi:hypothetical protein
MEVSDALLERALYRAAEQVYTLNTVFLGADV